MTIVRLPNNQTFILWLKINVQHVFQIWLLYVNYHCILNSVAFLSRSRGARIKTQFRVTFKLTDKSP